MITLTIDIHYKNYNNLTEWIQDKIHKSTPNIYYRKIKGVIVVIDVTFFYKCGQYSKEVKEKEQLLIIL